MPDKCPSCGAPAADNSGFCSHCGTRLTDNKSGRAGSKSLKIKRWISWLLCIACLCVGTISHQSNENLSVICFILFVASGIYAIVITFISLFRKRQ